MKHVICLYHHVVLSSKYIQFSPELSKEKLNDEKYSYERYLNAYTKVPKGKIFCMTFLLLDRDNEEQKKAFQMA